MSSRASRLLNLGMATFRFEASARVASIITGFEGLLQETEAVKRSWTIDRSGPTNDPDDGLIYRCGDALNTEGEKYDEKYFFHFKAGLPQLLKSAGASALKRHQEFLADCEELHNALTIEVLDLARELDALAPGLGLHAKMVSRKAMGMHCLRLLWYLRARPEGERNVIGKYHCDRDTLTLHVADRYPGLCVGPALAPYEAKPDRALAFWGRKAPNLDPRFSMIGHEVRDFAPDVKRPPRWSIVFFSHTDTPIADTVRYPMGRETARPVPETLAAALAIASA